MRYALIAFIFACCLNTAARASDYMMLKVNDHDIAASTVTRAWEKLFPPGTSPAFDTVPESTRQHFLRGLVTEQLLLIEAQKSPITTSTEFEIALQDAKHQLMLQHWVAFKTEGSITEERLKQAYHRFLEQNKNAKEIQIRHILVTNEQEAREVRNQLKEGESFAALSKAQSIDAATAEDGGYLGVLRAEELPPSLAKAALDLKPGEFSKPVRSMFGWHVLQIINSRPAPIPSFQQQRDHLRAQLEKEILASYAASLMKSANVQYFDASGAPLPLSKTAPKPAAADEAE